MITKEIPMEVDFVKFLSSIEQDYVLLVDEFEKIFDEYKMSGGNETNSHYHSQESFLSFMDGTVTSKFKRVFLLTANDRVNDKMVSRPSRIRYFKSYTFMNQDLYDEIVDKFLVNKKKFEKDLRENLPLVNASVDLLKCIIQEINLHNKAYSEFMDFFNFRPKSITYEVWQMNKEGEFSWNGTFDSAGEIGRDSTYINGQHGCKVMNVVGEYIYYKMSHTEAAIGKSKKQVDTHFRLKKVGDLNVMYGRPDKILTL